LSVLQIPTAEVFEPLLHPARYKGARGGRGSAKSHFFAGLAVEESLASKVDIVCIREVQRTLDQSVKKLIELKIQEHGVSSQFAVKHTHIESSRGGRIIFEGMQNHTADSIKSLEGFDRAWVEEAQTLSQRSLDLLRPTIRKNDSELWFSWNPRFASDPVDVLLRGEKPPPGTVVVEANFQDNPWFPDVLRKEMEYDRSRDPDKYAHVWLGGYEQHSEARVFKNWIVEEFERPAGTIHRLGADWGYAIDPSVLIRCSIDAKRLYVDHEAYMIGCEIVNLPELFQRVPESNKWFITADSARPETISHMQKHGYPKINPAIKGARSLEEGVSFLQSFDIVVHPRCTHLIDELTMYKYKTDPLTGKVIPQLEDKHNHCIDALRYACEGARRLVRSEMTKALKYDNRHIV
jgi:phage terminase large subunit